MKVDVSGSSSTTTDDYSLSLLSADWRLTLRGTLQPTERREAGHGRPPWTSHQCGAINNIFGGGM